MQMQHKAQVTRCGSVEDRSRRMFLHASAGLVLLPPLMLADLQAARADRPTPDNVLTLQSAARAEMNAYDRYIAFARKAQAEGYEGVSYLFIALATSEIIHGQNYNRLLTRMGADIVPSGNSSTEVSDTRKNLIAAAKAELNSIENFYPELLNAISDGDHSDTVRFVRYAWESHKQHIEIIDKIRKYAPSFFETVARRIDENTDTFHVCEICGSTTNDVPSDECPICKYPARHYQKIDPGAILG